MDFADYIACILFFLVYQKHRPDTSKATRSAVAKATRKGQYTVDGKATTLNDN